MTAGETPTISFKRSNNAAVTIEILSSRVLATVRRYDLPPLPPAACVLSVSTKPQEWPLAKYDGTFGYPASQIGCDGLRAGAAVSAEMRLQLSTTNDDAVLDNDFATWRALGSNDALPAKYLYDGQGRLVKRRVGEGHYDEIEAEIRRQLIAAKLGTQLPSITPEATAFAKIGQPSYAGITNETYVGSEHGEPGAMTLEGDWRSERQYLELRKGNRQDHPFLPPVR